uniref:uncharacterized protein LOC100181268 isoform X2 n=1 Tax=Ciona intestinalis TaxID=7719 RepID=UPI00089DB440|nr:uncharacterized protein LOC100181268 isoform X2 [Ciona intestinalis]|eukprot:XP_002124544.4 uncharacterized protein LOC100181268 isoform X2 [Ciona intestinalis]
MRRQCLAILNYFKSVERTITIFDGGLSLEAEESKKNEKESSASEKEDNKKKGKLGSKKNQASYNQKVEQASGGKGHSRGIGSHHYMHNTPADFKIDQNKFMEFNGVENHDDFYTLDPEETDPVDEGVGGDGGVGQGSITASSLRTGSLGFGSTPHVQDQRGYYIIYESALIELKELEKELLLMASQFIHKDTENRSVHRRSSPERVQRRHEAPGEVDIASYGHREIDRFAVILDMWTCELNFLVNKRKLLDCYLEAYQNTFDPVERQDITQILTDILHQRPRYDFTHDYFIRVYRNECACLRLRTLLLTQILSSHIDDCRTYVKQVTRPNHMLGMPLSIPNKQEIALNLSKPALKHLDMVEFHPTLGVAANRVYEALRGTMHDLEQTYRPTCMSEHINLEKQALELAQREWNGMLDIGASYPAQIQKDLFCDAFVEVPSLVCDAVQAVLAQEIENSATKIADSRSVAMETWKKSLEVILLRHRLIEAAGETEILARLYKQASSEMGFEEFHMYLRLVQFEFANRKEKVDPHPSTITNFIPDDISADRFIPQHMLLAIQEMDENHLPKFSFRTRESFIQFVDSDSCLENMRVVVACQVTHKNALTVAITQSNNCSQWKEMKAASHNDTTKGSETRSSHSISTTLTQGTARSGAASPNIGRRGHSYAGKLKFGFDKQKRAQDAFISIQLEKTGPRDVVVNAFIHKKETAGMTMRKPGEIEKLKRTFVTDFCKEVSFRMGLHAMRSQIIACYSNILSALEPFPSTRDNYFLVGRPHEKKRKLDDVSAMIPDPKSLHRRPRRVLSPDGKSFMNIWFIPHYTEVVIAYRNLDYEAQQEVLSTWLLIASSLHDIILYLCAHARLGSARLKQQLVDQSNYSVAADWGGAEGVGSELSEIQQQINILKEGAFPYTKDPKQVANLLTLKKENFFLQFDAAVRHAMRETFLATENLSAFHSINNNMHFALPSLSNITQGSLTCFIRCPEPLDAGTSDAKILFPWLSFQCSNGHHPTAYPQYWKDVESCTQLCLAGLSNTERQCANGEILGVALLLQEVLKGGTAALMALEGTAEEMPKGFLMLCHVGKNGRPDSGKTPPPPKAAPAPEEENEEEEAKMIKPKGPEIDPTKPLSKMENPLEAYRLMNCFLKLWKQLELLKLNWGKHKLHIEDINSPELFRDFSHIFRSEIMAPVFTTMARQMGHLDQYDDAASDDQPISNPPGAPELAVRARLVIKLLDVLECHMISDVRHRIGRELTLVLAERSREETALPADLWRQSSGGGGAVRENFTVSRPHIVEDFIQRLMSEYESENGNVIFKKDHLNHALSKLASSVMQRERENYESYSAYYENLLRHHHHLLYMKELEMKAFKTKNSTTSDGDLNAQFQLADHSHELILEITALRAKITEMREQSMTMDQDIRDDVRKDYQDLVQNLFEACLQMKSRLAQCHLSIHDDVRGLISESREEAMRSLGKLKDQAASSTAEERLKTISAKEHQIKEMRHEKYELNMLLSKLNTLHHWKRSTTGGRYKVTVEKLTHEVTKTRQDCLGKQLVGKEEADLLREELHSARQSLQASEVRLKKAYEQMEREKKVLKEKAYKDAQEERSRQQLEHARQRNLDRLVIELEEKDKRFKALATEVERNTRYDQSNQIKVQKSLKEMSAQLSIERNLKLNAFDQVDNLQAQIMDTERDMTVHTPSRPTSATLSMPRTASAMQSRPQSSYHSARTTTPRFKVRPMTSVQSAYDIRRETPLPRKRPQTAAGRLKNRIAAAILTEMYPSTDEHETVIQLD